MNLIRCTVVCILLTAICSLHIGDVCPYGCSCSEHTVICFYQTGIVLNKIPPLPIDTVTLLVAYQNISTLSGTDFPGPHDRLNDVILQFDEIKVVEVGAFTNLFNLTTLSLANNLILRLNAGTFKFASKLNILYLEGNQNLVMDHCSLSGLSNLEVLGLHETNVSMSTELFVSENCSADVIPSLTFLDIIDTNTRTLDLALLTAFPGLLHLTMGKSEDFKIVEEALDILQSLEHLIISYPPSEFLGNYELSRLQNIISLSLSFGQNIPHTFLTSSSLKYIYIPYSTLEINNNYFSRIPLLENVSVTHSNITSLHKDAFNNLTNVRVVDFSVSNLTGIPEGLLSTALQDFGSIKLRGNPWLCDCNFLWVVEFLQTVSSRSSGVCTSPPEWSGFPVVNLTPDNFSHCSNGYDTSPTVTSSSFVTDNTQTATLTTESNPLYEIITTTSEGSKTSSKPSSIRPEVNMNPLILLSVSSLIVIMFLICLLLVLSLRLRHALHKGQNISTCQNRVFTRDIGRVVTSGSTAADSSEYYETAGDADSAIHTMDQGVVITGICKNEVTTYDKVILESRRDKKSKKGSYYSKNIYMQG